MGRRRSGSSGAALADGRLKPEQIGYIEAHGTGTPLGDPIEIGALSAVFGQRSQPLIVGSVKTNFGHLEMAAGVVGLMKLVLAVQHGQIPPHLHFRTPNPHIDWAASPLQVPVAPAAWPQVRAASASVASVHLVLAARTRTSLLPRRRYCPGNTQSVRRIGRCIC